MSEQLRFLAGGEIECLFIDPQDDERMERAQERSYYIPLNGSWGFGATDSVSAVQRDAAAMLDGLQPATDAEAERIGQWKQQVPEFTAADAANFRIYERFADPIPAYKRATLGLSYSELVRAHSGLLEFRFGQNLYQEGYYDNPEVSEIRIAPCPPEEYPRRRQWLMTAIGMAAGSFGLRAFAAKEDVSVSAFEGGTPLLGDPRTDIRPYQAAVFGMTHRYHEDHAAYVKYESEEKALNVSPWRQSKVRMLPGRFEHRRALFCDNTLNLLVDGMKYGFTEATPDEAASIKVTQVLATSPGEGFERTRDLDLMRTVGRMVLGPNGSWYPETQMWSTDFINTILAEQDIHDYGGAIVSAMCKNGLFAIEGGHLQMNVDAIPAFVSAMPGHARDYYEQRQFNFGAAQARLRRIAVEPVPTIVRRKCVAVD